MRVMILFDLPTDTHENRKEYRSFRKFLLTNGFVMMQESVYSKIVLNSTAATLLCEKVRKNKTSAGLIQMLIVTERQFEKVEIIVGERQTTIIDSDDKLVIL